MHWAAQSFQPCYGSVSDDASRIIEMDLDVISIGAAPKLYYVWGKDPPPPAGVYRLSD